jgi:hypothetical protein
LKSYSRKKESSAGLPFILEGLARKFQNDIGTNFELKIEGQFKTVFNEVSSKSTDKIENMRK